MRLRPNRPPRLRRRAFRPEALAGPLAGRLADAHRLMEAGQPAAAAQAFGDLAQQAAHDGQFRRAWQLHLRAADVYAQVGDGDRALAEARAGLAWLKRLGRAARAGAVGERVAASLRAAGLNAPAEALARELAGLPSAPAAAETAPASDRGRLPARCPQCGGPIRSDDVDWIDDQSAECPYCGSTVLTER